MLRHYMIFAIVFTVLSSLNAEEKTVLIMKEKTSYKNALIKQLLVELEDGNTNITLVDHHKDDIRQIDPTAYDAVFITNSGAQAKVRPKVLAWLEANAQQDDNVILHTTQTSNWKPSVKVDSITSASSKKNIESLSKDIAGRIRALF